MKELFQTSNTQAPRGRNNFEPRPTGGVVFVYRNSTPPFRRGSTVSRPRGAFASALQGNSGYALYLVLVVLTVSTILFTIAFRSSAAAKVAAINYKQLFHAKLLAESGIERAEYFLNGGDGHDLNWETEKFEERLNSFGNIEISCESFGGYAKIKSKGIKNRKTHTIDALMGRDIPKNIDAEITLTGHVGGMVLYDGSTINGTVVLHHGTVKRGKSKSPIPNSHLWTTQRESPQLPFDKKKLEDVIKNEINNIKTINNKPDYIAGSVYLTSEKDTILKKDDIYVDGNVTISNVMIKDKNIYCSGDATIDKNAFIINSKIVGEKVSINSSNSQNALFISSEGISVKEGTHSSQFFANDTIIIKRDTKLKLNNLLVSHRSIKADTILAGGITIERNDDINGNLICFSDSINTTAKIKSGASITVDDRCDLTGTLITDGDINMKEVTINGKIWARSIVTSDGKVSYKNWLLGCRINRNKTEGAFPLIGELPAKVSLIGAVHP